MKILRLIITGTCVAALTFLLPLSASAQGSKSKASPTASPSPAATAKASASASPATVKTAGKPARAIPLRGTATSIDKSAKSFTIAGKTSSRVFKATDATKISKGGSDATFGDLAENDYVTGSYLKGEDGTLELKSLKIGGKADAEKASSTKKKTGKDAAAEDKEGSGE